MPPRSTAGTGLALALLSAVTFATSGTFARSLIEAGWSAEAVVVARVGLAALVLAVPAVLALRGRAGGAAPQPRPGRRLRPARRRHRPGVLLQRRPLPAGRGGPAAGVSRHHPRGGLDVAGARAAPPPAHRGRFAGRRWSGSAWCST